MSREAVQLMLDWSEFQDGWGNYGPWIVTHKGDQSVRILADRHYTRQKKGARQFTRPGKNIVLRTADAKACFVTYSSQYRKDGYDCWECTIFRNESEYKSSELIKWAIIATISEWGEFPRDGYITYVNGEKVNSENPGYCFIKAGFKKIPKKSSKGLSIFQLDINDHYLIHEELKAKETLLYHQEMIQLALEGGEWMETRVLLKEALSQQKYLLNLQDEMKLRKIKAASDYPETLNEWELASLMSPDGIWVPHETIEWLLEN